MIATTQIKKISLGDGWTLNILNPRIATITNPQGQRKTSYFGFDSKNEAEAFAKAILIQGQCSDARVRKSERLSTTWECKVWHCPTELILALLARENSSKPTLI